MHLNERTRAEHDDVHIDVGGGVFDVGKIEPRFAIEVGGRFPSDLDFTTREEAEAIKPIDILTGGQHSRDIAAGRCTGCKLPAFEFRNALSQKEHRISGLCQTCQDDVFGNNTAQQGETA